METVQFWVPEKGFLPVKEAMQYLAICPYFANPETCIKRLRYKRPRKIKGTRDGYVYTRIRKSIDHICTGDKHNFMKCLIYQGEKL